MRLFSPSLSLNFHSTFNFISYEVGSSHAKVFQTLQLSSNLELSFEQKGKTQSTEKHKLNGNFYTDDQRVPGRKTVRCRFS